MNCENCNVYRNLNKTFVSDWLLYWPMRELTFGFWISDFFKDNISFFFLPHEVCYDCFSSFTFNSSPGFGFSTNIGQFLKNISSFSQELNRTALDKWKFHWMASKWTVFSFSQTAILIKSNVRLTLIGKSRKTHPGKFPIFQFSGSVPESVKYYFSTKCFVLDEFSKNRSGSWAVFEKKNMRFS